MFRQRAFALTAALAFAGALAARADDPAAAPSTLSAADREALVAMLEAGLAETDALVAKAEGDLFTRKPAPDRWSVAEILEHIGTTEETLFGAVEGSLAGPVDPEAPALLAAQPIDAFATVIKDRSRKFQAPDMLVPTGTKGGREELLARYHAAHARTLEFVRTTQADVANHTAPTPMGKMTTWHFLTLIAAHNLRHNQQMAEAIEQLAAAPAGAGTTQE